MEDFTGIDEVRRAIDSIDRDIMPLLAVRASYVAQASRFKKERKNVVVPERIEEIVRRVRHLAVEHDMDPDLAERIYRAMIDCFILYEAQVWDKIHGQGDTP